MYIEPELVNSYCFIIGWVTCYILFLSNGNDRPRFKSTDWKPISTAPQDREIMVTDGVRVSFATWTELFTPNMRGEKFVWKCREWGEANPTHWDEMPQLP